MSIILSHTILQPVVFIPLFFSSSSSSLLLSVVQTTGPLPSGQAYLLGWGATSSGGPVQPVLRGVDLNPVSGGECIQYAAFVSEDLICVGGPGHAPCTHDDGAPLLYHVNGTWTIYGIVADDTGCGGNGTYGLFTNVASYYEFLYGQNMNRPDGKLYGGFLCSGASALAPASLLLVAFLGLALLLS